MNENEIKPGSLEDEANKAITCLYIAVDASIADDVKQRVGAFVCQLKREYAEKNETANVFMGQVKKLQSALEKARHQLLDRCGIDKDSDNAVALEINKVLAEPSNEKLCDGK